MFKRFDYQFLRFGLVGLVNTGVDIFIYITLLSITGSILLSNTVSTATALIVSLFLNKKFTFRVTKLTSKRLILFFVVTLIGLWVLQPLVIFSSTAIVHDVFLLDSKSTLVLVVPKIIATAFTVIWNYLLYTYVVFKK